MGCGSTKASAYEYRGSNPNEGDHHHHLRYRRESTLSLKGVDACGASTRRSFYLPTSPTGGETSTRPPFDGADIVMNSAQPQQDQSYRRPSHPPLNSIPSRNVSPSTSSSRLQSTEASPPQKQAAASLLPPDQGAARRSSQPQIVAAVGGEDPSPPPSEQHQPPPPPPPPVPVLEWRKGSEIGRGATGTVYEGIDTQFGRLIAIKQIDFPEDLAEDPEALKRLHLVLQEVRLLMTLQHDNIVQFLGVDRQDFRVYLLMEYVQGGSIRHLLTKYGPLTESVAARYAEQILKGLCFLHSRGIVHRDIKGANILVDKDGRCKISDFGAARIVSSDDVPKSLHGTPYWMAPEVIRQQGHGSPADIWSFGSTVVEMLTGKPPFVDMAPAAAFMKIGQVHTEMPVPQHLSSKCRQFLLRCFVRDPLCRATAMELLKHPWIHEATTAAITTHHSS
eukprot:PhF_6_TR20806/c0_g1_i1/m.29891